MAIRPMSKNIVHYIQIMWTPHCSAINQTFITSTYMLKINCWNQAHLKGTITVKFNMVMVFWSFLMAQTNCQHSEVFTIKHSVPSHSIGILSLLLTSSQFTYTAVILDNQVFLSVENMADSGSRCFQASSDPRAQSCLLKTLQWWMSAALLLLSPHHYQLGCGKWSIKIWNFPICVLREQS